MRVPLQLEEPGPERRPFRDRERAQEPSLERGEDRPLLWTLEPDLLNARHRVLLRGEASLQWGCHSTKSRVIDAEREGYRDRRQNPRDKNPYHAGVDARVSVGTTTYGIGRAQHHNSTARPSARRLPGG